MSDNLPPSKFLSGQPQGQDLELHQAWGWGWGLVAVKGMNTQVPTISALRGSLRPAGNRGHREFGPKCCFVFRVTAI